MVEVMLPSMHSVHETQETSIISDQVFAWRHAATIFLQYQKPHVDRHEAR